MALLRDLARGLPAPRRAAERALAHDPFDGIGKPEPLKHTLAGAWSRRITEEHRLVYLPQDDQLTIIAARYHYE